MKYGKHCFKENNNMVAEKSQSNDKHLENITSSSYHMEQKTFIGQSKLHLEKRFFFVAASFEGA